MKQVAAFILVADWPVSMACCESRVGYFRLLLGLFIYL